MTILNGIKFSYGRALMTAVLAAVVLLSACDDDAIACKMAVTSGFHGDLEAVYSAGDGGGSGDGNGGDGGDGGGGAGAGGGEGKVLRALLRVTRLSDSVVVGENETDGEKGLVTVQTCGNAGAMLITLKGKAGATYFDEGKNAFVEFGADEELHALVDGLYENVGVSAFTEAAYRYAINNFLVDPLEVASGKVPLQKTSELVPQLAPKHIELANRIVLDEINSKLPSGYHLVSLTALPTPIGPESGIESIKPGRYGAAAVVTGGFAWMANQFNPTASAEQSAALQATDALANDLTDGKIDGYALNGLPAHAAMSGTTLPSAAYDSVRLPVDLHVGANAVAATFSKPITDAAPNFADISAIYGDCVKRIPGALAALRKDGSVTVRRLDYCMGGNEEVTPNFATGVAHVAKGSEALYLLHTDGSVSGWGSQHCSALGDGGESGYISAPKVIPGLTNITSVVGGPGYALARDSSGRVWSWGQNGSGNLGRESLDTDPTCIVHRNPGEDPTKVTTTPTLIPGLNDIVSIQAAHKTVFAIDKQGVLYQWGFTGLNDTRTTVPTRVAGLGPVRAVVGIPDMWFALQTDGKVFGWGRNSRNNFGDGSIAPPIPKPEPQMVPGLSGVREIAGDGCSILARMANGTVKRWGGCDASSVVSVPTVTPELAGLQIRHVADGNYSAFLFARDGKLLEYNDVRGDRTPGPGVRDATQLFPSP